MSHRHDARTTTTSLLASSINAQKIKISVLIELKTMDREGLRRGGEGSKQKIFKTKDLKDLVCFLSQSTGAVAAAYAACSALARPRNAIDRIIMNVRKSAAAALHIG